MTTAQDVVDFWLSLPPSAHFKKDPAMDAELAKRFGEALTAARHGDHDNWAETTEGALGLVILLDQFSRNIHRDTPDMFATDAKALQVAKQVIASGEHTTLPIDHQKWLFMPFMHSEDLADQEQCIELCRAANLEANIPYAIEHADIIRRFGRFPHRNAILGRTSTPEEVEFLEAGGFSG